MMVNTIQASLLIQGGPNSGSTLPLSHRPITLGRRPDNDVVVDENTVSRRHALIMETPGGFVVRDLNTMNGTYVNRGKIGQDERVLTHGDKIRLAASKVSLIYRQEGSDTVQFGRVAAGAERVATPGHSVEKPPTENHLSQTPSLTPKDTELLRMFESKKGNVVSREEIARAVWPEMPGANADQAIDASIENIRISIGDDMSSPNHLLTVGEFGFLLV
jgi:pSer/pThr/pTyr-binding forkhead associated (FHA) protein